MVNLTGHAAGNGGYSQGTPTARRAFLYSERARCPLLCRRDNWRSWLQTEICPRSDSRTSSAAASAGSSPEYIFICFSGANPFSKARFLRVRAATKVHREKSFAFPCTWHFSLTAQTPNKSGLGYREPISSSREIIVPTLAWLAASGGRCPGRASLNSRLEVNFLISFAR